MSERKYTGLNGEALTEAEFVEQANAMPEAGKYKAKGRAYAEASFEFYMEHGSKKLRRQMRQYVQGLRLTLEPAQLSEVSALGEQFDAYWQSLN